MLLTVRLSAIIDKEMMRFLFYLLLDIIIVVKLLINMLISLIDKFLTNGLKNICSTRELSFNQINKSS